jgi:hypothetical protein
MDAGPTILCGATEPLAPKPCQSWLQWAPAWVMEYHGGVDAQWVGEFQYAQVPLEWVT